MNKVIICGLSMLMLSSTSVHALPQQKLTINVVTGSNENASTDDPISIMVHGALTSTEYFQLDTPNHNDFEKNKPDTYSHKVTSGKYLGDIIGITVRMGQVKSDKFFNPNKDKRAANGWQIGSIEVKDSNNTNNKAKFFDGDGQWVDDKVDNQPGLIQEDWTDVYASNDNLNPETAFQYTTWDECNNDGAWNNRKKYTSTNAFQIKKGNEHKYKSTEAVASSWSIGSSTSSSINTKDEVELTSTAEVSGSHPSGVSAKLTVSARTYNSIESAVQSTEDRTSSGSTSASESEEVTLTAPGQYYEVVSYPYRSGFIRVGLMAPAYFQIQQSGKMFTRVMLKGALDILIDPACVTPM